MLPELTDAEALRYNRQIVLRGFDFDGQEKLKAARVLIAGLGGLGCAAAPYLAAQPSPPRPAISTRAAFS
ncbi:ThiF family adenylyltransferase, partial [Serratia marcescens]|uniref:ThiF family adenylyltransferase n=1 Tax=Serratia marcescens TaxID=615 RepID=UPI001560363D